MNNIKSIQLNKILHSHFTQIYLTRKLRVKNVLEIGIGYGFVSSVLSQYCNLTTLDYEKKLNPNILLDITKLKQLDTLRNREYDLILICEVLEHIPYEKIDKILKILKEKTRKYIIISVPNQTIYLNLVLFNNSSRLIFKNFKDSFNLFFIKVGNLLSKLDYNFRKKHKKYIFGLTSKIHHWSLGIDKYDVELFRKLLQKYFIILKEKRVKEHSYHHFFILKKK